MPNYAAAPNVRLLTLKIVLLAAGCGRFEF
jgi:hypothetical protein